MRLHKNFKNELYRIIFGIDTPAGQLFDIVLLISILLSVLLVLLESVTDYRNRYTEWFYYAEWLFSLFFLVEYLLRVYCFPKTWRYALSFWGVVDLLATLPILVLFFAVDMQYLFSIRLLRLMRVFRVLRLGRHFLAAQNLGRALRSSSYKISVFVLGVVMLVVILGSLMYVIEGKQNGFNSIPKSIYWAIITITTVGYGDIVPQTDMGKFVASLIMLLGYGIIAVPTGIITHEIAREQQANQIKNCPRCGHPEQNPRANFCSHCGRTLGQDPAQLRLFDD
ncbi:MAG: ion transporter [Bernardetiaceae bacterium]